MATTTLRTFVDNIEALSITGVTTAYTHGPPTKLEAAQLPAQWVQFPSLMESPLVFGEPGGWPTYQATLIVAYEAVAQSIQGTNFDGTVDMMDNVLSALRAITDRCWPGGNKCNWSIRMTNVAVAEVMYWAIAVDIQG